MPESPRAAHQAVCVVVVRQRDELLGLVRRQSRGRVDAEEVVQKGLQRALERSDQLLDPANADAWVAQIVRRLVVDELRRRKDFARTLDEDGAVPTGEQDTCRCALVQAAQLKPAYADILQRTTASDSTLSEIAAELGLTVNAAMVRLHRARAALRQRLRTHCGTTTFRECLDCVCAPRACCDGARGAALGVSAEVFE